MHIIIHRKDLLGQFFVQDISFLNIRIFFFIAKISDSKHFQPQNISSSKMFQLPKFSKVLFNSLLLVAKAPLSESQSLDFVGLLKSKNVLSSPLECKGPFPLQSQFAKRMQFANSEFKKPANSIHTSNLFARISIVCSTNQICLLLIARVAFVSLFRKVVF